MQGQLLLQTGAGEAQLEGKSSLKIINQMGYLRQALSSAVA